MSKLPESNFFNDSMDLFDDDEEEHNVNKVHESNVIQMETYPKENEQRNGDTNFQCPFCNELELNEYRLHEHILSSHPEYNFQNLSDSLNSHLQIIKNDTNKVLTTGTFVCPYCSSSQETNETLALHLTKIHGDELEHKDLEEMIRTLSFLLCPLCKFICSSSLEIQKHVEVQHSSTKESFKKFSGNEASSSFSSSDSHITICPVCGLHELDPAILTSHIELHFDTSSCSANHAGPSFPSTSKNTKSDHQLSASSSSNSSSMSSETKVYDKRKRNGYHYKHQYRQGLERAVVKGKLSPGDYHEHLAQMQEKDLNGVDDGHSKVEGLVQRLESFYRHSSREDQTVILCSPLDYFCGSYGDKGWGCGYRNFQMMLSCLSGIHSYSSRLFKDGRVKIPSVPKIQEMIESAWQKGFDQEGCLQLEGKVSHTRKWIGATEIVATLSSMGIRCELVDFLRPSSPDGTHLRLFQWVRDYFYRDQRAKPPLYLQHQGHSRTIVGVEIDKGTTRLLLFDPGSSKEHVSSLKNSHLSWKKMASFRRNLAAFKAKQYQIVSVVGLLSKEEYERSKRLVSTRIL